MSLIQALKRSRVTTSLWQSRTNRDDETRITKIAVLLVTVYCLSLRPIAYHIMRLYATHLVPINGRSFVMGITGIRLNCVLNPALYHYSNENIRKRVITMVRHLSPKPITPPIKRYISCRSAKSVHLERSLTNVQTGRRDAFINKNILRPLDPASPWTAES